MPRSTFFRFLPFTSLQHGNTLIKKKVYEGSVAYYASRCGLLCQHDFIFQGYGFLQYSFALRARSTLVQLILILSDLLIVFHIRTYIYYKVSYFAYYKVGIYYRATFSRYLLEMGWAE